MSAASLRPLLLGLLLAASGSGSGATDRAVSLKKWIEGPVRYIAVKQEVQLFKELGSDEDRALFVEKFWARRDPDPETLTNPYRQLFWERVAQANSLFLDSSKAGWRTDRGKIHILYGPPTEIQEDIHLQTDGIAGGGTGLIRWVYEGRPGSHILDAVVVVPFVRDGSGEYRVSYDPKLSSIFFDFMSAQHARGDAYSRLREKYRAPGRSEMAVMLDLGKMQEVPPHEQVLLEWVETSEAYETRPLSVRTDRYAHPDDARTIVVVTVDIAYTAEESQPAVIARFVPTDPGAETRLLGEDSFRIEARDSRRVAQGRLLLDPGTYVLTVMVADPIDVSTGLYRASVTVPGPSETMRLSDVVWAETLETLPYSSLASYDEPYILGPFRVVPRLEPVYRQGETVRLFYEIYGASAPFRVSYQLEGQEDDGKWTALGQPSVDEQSSRSQGWELPTTSRWPAGQYRIRIEIEDTEGHLVWSERPFTLEAQETAGPS